MSDVISEVEVTFKDLNLNPNILRVLEDMGFTSPTEIQAKGIPVLLNTCKDFVGQAQTGTGKTAAFVIPLLEKIDFTNPAVQALILAPTRELATQVENEVKKLGKYIGSKSTCIYGGTGYESQIRALKYDKPQIVIGTPGRIIDMINKKYLKLGSAAYCVLDEADEMLNMGFFEDVQTILDQFKPERQLMMFSATMPRPIVKMIQRSFNNPEMVQIEKKSLSNDDIEQKYFIVREKHFKEALARLIDDADNMYGIVFCRTKIETREVADDLKKRGYMVEVLNGDMGQNERDHAMKNFKAKKATIMVCTDVAARGIDVSDLTHVFNYSAPRDNESYVHRIGRTGRAGAKGIAYTLIGPRGIGAIRSIERHINTKIEYAKLPTVEALKKNVVLKELEGAKLIQEAILSKGDDFKTEASFELFKEQFGELDKDALLKMMFVWKFNKEMRRFNNLADIESDNTSQSNSARRNRSGGGRDRNRSRTRSVGGSGSGSRRSGGNSKSFAGRKRNNRSRSSSRA